MSNEKWSQKPIITNPTESTRICLIDGSPVVENKTISIEDLNNHLVEYRSLVNKSLDMMPQLLYRNLEGDNMLASSDFSGRIRAIETPIIAIVNSGLEVTLANVPYIKGLIEIPGDWMLGWFKNDWSITINSSIRIVSIEYLGNQTVSGTEYSNCAKLTLVKASAIPVGTRGFICSFLAGGLTLQWDPTFKATKVNGTWNRQIVCCGYSWKTIDGKYKALVTGETNSAVGIKRAYITKVFEAEDRFGSWTNVWSNDSVGIFDGLLPPGYEGFTPLQQGIKSPYNPSHHIVIAGLYNSSNVMNKFAALVFNDDLSYRKLVELDVTYTPESGYSTAGYGLSTAYYKGEFLFSIQDGTHSNGVASTAKRVVFKSKYLEGPYTQHSIIYDLGETPEFQQEASVIGYAIANSALFVFNNELYCFSSGEGLTNSGNYIKHEFHLWKFNDADSTWTFVKGPVILSLHGDDDNYPEYPAIGAHVPLGNPDDGGWAKNHMGLTTFHYIEANKLWIGYGAKGYGQLATDSYQATIGYIDLTKALN